MRKLIIPVSLSLSLCLSACSLFPEVYKVSRLQGNIIKQDMVNKLAPGMTKEQVLYVMGSPLMIDTFHQERWDYVYTEQIQRGALKEEKLSVFFTDDKLASLQGDFVPHPGEDVDNVPAAVGESTESIPSAGSINAAKPEKVESIETKPATK